METTTSTAPSEVANSGSLSFGEKLSYGLGNFGEMMIFNPATSFIVFFYTDVAGIAAATVGTILLISRILDFFNPVMGLVVDRTRTRWGKGRPWLLWMAVPFGIAAVLLFTAPPLGMTGKIIYAFITYNLAFALIYTAVDVPYSAMMPLMTNEPHARTHLSLFRMSFAMIGNLVSFAVILPLVRIFGGGAAGWQRSSMIFGAFGTLMLLLCFLGTRERIKPAAGAGHQQVPTKRAFGILLRNKYWLIQAGLAFALFLGIGLYGANIYFCQYFLRSVELFGPLMTASQAALVIGMMLTAPMMKTLGKRNTGVAGTFIALAGQLIMFLSPTSFTVVAAGMMIKSLGMAPVVGTVFAMVADTVDYGQWKSGVRTDGLAFGAVTLVNKMTVGLGSALTGWILGGTGYVSGAATQSPAAMFGIKVMFLHIPLALLVLMLLLLWAYSLTRSIRASLPS